MRSAVVVLLIAVSSLLVTSTAHALAPVGNVTATPGSGQVQLAWTNPGSGDHDHTTIYRSSSRYGTYASIGTVAAAATAYTDSTAVNGTDYFYAVRAESVANIPAPVVQSGGVAARHYTTTALTTLVRERIEPTIDHPTTATMFGPGIRWTGFVKADFNENYTFIAIIDDGVRLWIDGVQVTNNWCTCAGTRTANVALSAGWHTVTMEYEHTGGAGSAQLRFQSISQPDIVIPATHLGTEFVLPATPSDATVTVTAPNGGETITGQTAIQWTRTGTVDHFEIDVSSDGGATWPTTVATSVPAASTSWTWTPPADTASSTYRIRVRAVSLGSNLLAADASNGDFTVNTPPAPPVTGLVATAGNGQVQLSWTNPVNPNFDHVQVLRSTQEGDPGVAVYTSPDNTVASWTDNTVANGTTYFYRVRSVTPSGASGPTLVPNSLRQSFYRDAGFANWNGSGLEPATTLSFPYDNLSVAPLFGENHGIFPGSAWSARWHGFLDIPTGGSWQFRASDIGAVRMVIGGTVVYNGSTGCCGTISGTIALSPGRYPVTIEKSSGAGGSFQQLAPGGAWTTMTRGSFWVEPEVVATPTAATATLTSPNGGETIAAPDPTPITWNAAGADVSTIQLWLSTDGGATYPTLLARDLPNSGSWSWWPGLSVSSATARIRVLAVTATGRTVAIDASNADFTIDTAGGPQPVQSVTATASASGQIDVAWTMPAPLGSTDHVAIYRTSTEGGIPALVHSTTDAATTTWTDTTVANGATYWYTVRTVDASGHQSLAIVPGTVDVTYFSDSSLASVQARETETTSFQRTFTDTGPSAPGTHGTAYIGWWGLRFTGWINVPTTDTWAFQLTNGGKDNTGRVFIDEQTVINSWTLGCCGNSIYGSAYLEAGWHRIRAEWADDGSGSTNLLWGRRGQGRSTIPIGSVGRELQGIATAHADTIQVTSPNGGESVLSTNPVSITWSTASPEITKVSVLLSTDGGATFPHVLGRFVPTAGSHSWTPPIGMTTNAARVRVIGFDGTGTEVARDDGNADFAIHTAGGPPPVQAVTATPSGVSQIDIDWTMPSPLGSTDHVAIYRTASEGTIPALVHTTVGTATTSWTDATVAVDTTYWYEVRTVDALGRETVPTQAGAIDTSYFGDNGLTQLEAREVEAQSMTRTFADTGPQSNGTHGRSFLGWWGLRMSGLVYIDASDTWVFQLGNGGKGNTGRVFIDDRAVINSWTLGCCGDTIYGSTYLTQGWHSVRVETTDDGAGSVSFGMGRRGLARSPVTLGQLARPLRARAHSSTATVTVTAPNGGETWRAHVPQPITWTTSGGAASNVRILLSTDGGATWPHMIAHQTPNTGSMTWRPPPGFATPLARIRVIALSGSDELLAGDSSDADFAIDTAAPPPPVSTVRASPNGAGRIDVSWTMPSPLGTTDHVVVYRSSSTRAEPVAVHTTPNAAATSWSDTTVLDGTTYWYTVRTVDAVGHEGRQIDAGMIDAEYHRGSALSQLEASRIESTGGNRSWDADGPISTMAPGPTLRSPWSSRWTGWVNIPTADTWVFQQINIYFNVRLWIDDVQLINLWTGSCCTGNSQYGTTYLTSGWHKISWDVGATDNASVDLRMGRRGQPRTSIISADLGIERRARVTATTATIALTSPDGGESWTSNASRPVTWTTTGAPPGATVRLSYSTDGGATWPNTIVRGLTSSPYSWKPPESLNTSTFRMRAELLSSAGERLDADESSADLTVDATQLTSSITNAAAVPGWQQIALSWTNPADPGFDHVNVYRSTNPAAIGTLVQAVAAPATSWTDTSLVNGTRYYYTLRAATAANEERISLVAGGLRGYYYSDSAFGTLAGTQIDPSVNFNWGTGGPAILGSQVDNFSVRWVGYVYAGEDDNWIFDNAATNDTGTLRVNDMQLATGSSAYGSIQLAQGWHPVSLTMTETTSSAAAYFHSRRTAVARAIVAPGNLAVEAQVTAQPADVTAPVPNPVGAAVANSPTQITWNAFGASDGHSGLPAQPYSFDGGGAWQASDTFVRTALSPNTTYAQSVRVRDAAGNMTSTKVVTARTLAVDPSVSASHATSTWHGPGSTSITFSNLVPFGAGGVEYYKWAVTTTAGYSFTGAEPNWSSAALVRPFTAPGKYYLHVRSYNGDDVGGATGVLGPFWIDSEAPTPNPATVTHVSTGSTVQFDVSPVNDADSGLAANAYSFDNGSSWVASPSDTATGLSPNTSVSRQIRTRDALGNVSAMVVHAAATLPVDPSITSAPASGATWYPGGTTFTLTSGVAFGPGTLWGYRYVLTTNPGATVSTADPSWTSGTLPVPIASTGTWYVRARSYNLVGDGGTTVTVGPFNVDTTAPPGVTPSAVSPTGVAPVLNWTSVVDGESGLAGYRIYRSTTSGALGSQVGSRPAGATSYTDADVLVDDTTYWYTVQAYDAAGNEQVVGNLQIAVTYSSTPPSAASLTIAGGAGATSSDSVTLGITAANAAQMQVSNAPDFAGATWEPYATTLGWTLATGDGTRTVYARFRNGGGTVAGTVSDSIVLDTTAPQGDPPGITVNVVSATQVQFTSETVSDAGAGLPATPYSFDAGASWQAGVTWDRTGLAPNTTYAVELRSRDALGNQSGTRAATATTLAAAPSVTSTPLPDPGAQPRGTTFTFSNLAGWGAGGVEYYRWAWSTSATHAFAGTEAMWTSGTLPQQELAAGTYYMHLRAYNSEDVAGATLDLGPYVVAPPQTPADLTVNIAGTQTLACTTTNFAVALLPGDQDDATVACTVTSALAGWNLQAHAGAAPFFAGFVDAAATPAAYAAPGVGDAQVSFTAAGATSDAAFADGTLWRGFAGLSDIRIGGDAGTSSGDVVTTRVRAHLDATAGLAPGARTQTITYTLNPGV